MCAFFSSSSSIIVSFQGKAVSCSYNLISKFYVVYFLFTGQYYWMLTAEGIASGYPKLISSSWKGLPGNIDAAFTYKNGKTYFFKVREKNPQKEIVNEFLFCIGDLLFFCFTFHIFNLDSIDLQIFYSFFDFYP